MENNKTKKCSHCQTDIDINATKCPHCQSYLRPWASRHPIWSGVIVVLAFLIVISAIGGTEQEPADTAPATSVTTQDTATSTPVITPTVVASTPKTSVMTKPSKSISSTPSTPTAPAVPKSWHTAFTYSGSSDTQTRPFTLQGSEWRITYSCQTTDSEGIPGNFYGYIYGTDGSMASDFAQFVRCPTTNTSYEYSQPAGQYYLKTMSPSASYTVTIEDSY